MKAVRMVEIGKPLENFELPEPSVGPNDVLVAVKAAGICHSDAHYRSGVSPVDPLPLTLGHEVSGVVEEIGARVRSFETGERVCLHYMVTCGVCEWCNKGSEQFCVRGKMIGKYRDGGFAEYIQVPERSVFRLPEEIGFDHGAVLMCSSATALHALKVAGLKPGESVAVFGVGGLGISAIQLAHGYGASQVYAVDLLPVKLDLAEKLGAFPVNPADGDPASQIMELTNGRGVDVSLELVGLPVTMDQAFRSLGIKGRAAIAGLTDQKFEIEPYRYLLNREAQIIGVSDHLAQEIPELIYWVQKGVLDLSHAVTARIPLDEEPINAELDRLDRFGEGIRTVVEP
jgi:D-arabinose 1-dehydrogenase-like Zn-dependent alcohol dehydrogenase